MRTGLIALGVIFIVLGIVFYYFPNPGAGASATTVNEGGATTKSSFASVSVPIQMILASLIIGALFLVLGLIIPHPYGAPYSVREDRREGRLDKDIDEDDAKDHLIQTKEEEIRGKHGSRRVIKERREHHRTV